jgi:predicted small secreted protein
MKTLLLPGLALLLAAVLAGCATAGDASSGSKVNLNGYISTGVGMKL